MRDLDQLTASVEREDTAPAPGSRAPRPREPHCGYPSKPCANARAWKRDGTRHRFCEFHRAKANANQQRWAKRRQHVPLPMPIMDAGERAAMGPRMLEDLDLLALLLSPLSKQPPPRGFDDDHDMTELDQNPDLGFGPGLGLGPVASSIWPTGGGDVPMPMLNDHDATATAAAWDHAEASVWSALGLGNVLLNPHYV